MITRARLKTVLKINGALLASALLAACGGESSNPELDELNDARLLWQSFGISQYHLSITRLCFCLPEDGPTNIIVDDDIVEVYTGQFIPEQQLNSSLERTVDQWFDEIERIIENDNSSATVVYDDVYGYPTDVYFDNAIDTVDDEVSYGMTLGSHYELKAQLAESKSLWDNQNLQNYTFTYNILAFIESLNGDIRISVTNNVITQANYVNSGEAVDTSRLKTIDQWFESLTQTSNNPRATVTVEFDAVAGYPISISGGPVLPYLDSGYEIQISNVQ